MAVKGLGGFHLAADAENDGTVKRLRRRKLREEKPFALMSFDLEKIARYARVQSEEERLLSSPQRPIVLLKKKHPHPLSDAVSPGNCYFGTMLPYTPLHYLLLSHDFTALVMTSGNRSDEPICTDEQEAFRRLSGIADYFLVHNRDIFVRADDSIVRAVAGETRMIRRSRGYAPVPLFLRENVPPVLACGAELKNTICLTRENQAFLSQHIGDLENLATYDFFVQTIEHLENVLRIRPQVVAYDRHPDYLSTRYARERAGVEKVAVQHHHAHIAGCMAEHRIEGPVMGLAFDGTGWGPDGTIWGGEILIADQARFRRVASLSPLPMPGGAAAVREPWRMAVSCLYDAFGEGLQNLDLPWLNEVGVKKVGLLVTMIQKGINAPMTSSLGRLFDGVAAILGLRRQVSFEGQAAMDLEMLAGEAGEAHYDDQWEEGEVIRVLPVPIIEGVVRDLRRGKPRAEISRKFHKTLIVLFARLCAAIKKTEGLNRVCLSGGVFQNRILLCGLTEALEARGFEVFSHRLVPTNDGGISLGQALIAAATLKKSSKT